MEFLIDLWQPILLSAVFVFVVSSILHMVIQHHNKDYGALEREAEIMKALRDNGVTPGHYMIPRPASVKDANTPQMLERYNQGPVGYLTVIENGPPKMGQSLRNWFLFTIVASALVAYIVSFTLPTDASYLDVMRLAGTVAFLCYGGCEATQSIWKGQSWGITLRFLFDSLVYGLVTGGTFGWLWAS